MSKAKAKKSRVINKREKNRVITNKISQKMAILNFLEKKMEKVMVIRRTLSVKSKEKKKFRSNFIRFPPPP